MKRHIFLAAAFLFSSFPFLMAQNEEDALRYSQLFDVGATARSMSMGGAFGALGGDLYSMSINPAGLGVFRKSVMVLTPSFMHDKTSSIYLGTYDDDRDNHFSMGNFGGVYAINTGNSTGLVNFNFGFSYAKRTDYWRTLDVRGINDHSSMLDDFASRADGYYAEDLDPYNELLAFNTWLIDTVRGNPVEYETVLSQYGDLPNSTYGELQRRTLYTSGSSNEYVFAFATNYSYKLYVGGTFTIRSLRYESSLIHSEDDLENAIFDFNYFDFRYHLRTYGSSFSGSFGMIVRPVTPLRIGASVHFPSVYRLHDSYFSSIESGFDTPDDEGNTVYKDNSPNGFYDYKLTTPWRFVGSLAFQIKTFALISLDYEYVDYKGMKLRSMDGLYDFYDENSAIRSAYRGTSNIHGGAEVNLGAFAVRAGAAWYGSPYQTTELNKDASTMAYTAGVGYRSRDFSIDLGYMYMSHDENYVLYGGTTDFAAVSSDRHRVSATFTFRF
jgi:hypothetical protein